MKALTPSWFFSSPFAAPGEILGLRATDGLAPFTSWDSGLSTFETLCGRLRCGCNERTSYLPRSHGSLLKRCSITFLSHTSQTFSSKMWEVASKPCWWLIAGRGIRADICSTWPINRVAYKLKGWSMGETFWTWPFENSGLRVTGVLWFQVEDLIHYVLSNLFLVSGSVALSLSVDELFCHLWFFFFLKKMILYYYMWSLSLSS